MTTPITFELAKLLKEKEFDKPTYSFYVIDESEYGEISEFITNPNDNYPALDDNSLFDTLASAPTIAEVVMWLYEKHGIWISVDWMTRKKPFNSGFYCHLRGTSKPLNQDNFFVINDTLDPGYEVFNSPTEAYLAAIEYILNNLI